MNETVKKNLALIASKAKVNVYIENSLIVKLLILLLCEKQWNRYILVHEKISTYKLRLLNKA
jgi:hypothetical protein